MPSNPNSFSDQRKPGDELPDEWSFDNEDNNFSAERSAETSPERPKTFDEKFEKLIKERIAIEAKLGTLEQFRKQCVYDYEGHEDSKCKVTANAKKMLDLVDAYLDEHPDYKDEVSAEAEPSRKDNKERIKKNPTVKDRLKRVALFALAGTVLSGVVAGAGIAVSNYNQKKAQAADTAHHNQAIVSMQKNHQYLEKMNENKMETNQYGIEYNYKGNAAGEDGFGYNEDKNTPYAFQTEATLRNCETQQDYKESITKSLKNSPAHLSAFVYNLSPQWKTAFGFSEDSTPEQIYEELSTDKTEHDDTLERIERLIKNSSISNTVINGRIRNTGFHINGWPTPEQAKSIKVNTENSGFHASFTTENETEAIVIKDGNGNIVNYMLYRCGNCVRLVENNSAIVSESPIIEKAPETVTPKQEQKETITEKDPDVMEDIDEEIGEEISGDITQEDIDEPATPPAVVVEEETPTEQQQPEQVIEEQYDDEPVVPEQEQQEQQQEEEKTPTPIVEKEDEPVQEQQETITPKNEQRMKEADENISENLGNKTDQRDIDGPATPPADTGTLKEDGEHYDTEYIPEQSDQSKVAETIVEEDISPENAYSENQTVDQGEDVAGQDESDKNEITEAPTGNDLLDYLENNRTR